jgi:hypothetical protein
MSTAKVKVFRPEEDSDIVLLNFNEDAFKLVMSQPLVFEENKQGILITVPEIDNGKSIRVTFKKRSDIEFSMIEDFDNNEWFPIFEVGEGAYQINMFDGE